MTSPPVARKAAEKKRTIKQTDRHRNWKFDEEAAYAKALSWVGEQLEARYVDPPAPPAPRPTRAATSRPGKPRLGNRTDVLNLSDVLPLGAWEVPGGL